MSKNLINDMLNESSELLSQDKTIVEWFDPANKDHMTAYKAFLETKAWPVGVVPEGVALTPGWEGHLAKKIQETEVLPGLGLPEWAQKGIHDAVQSMESGEAEQMNMEQALDIVASHAYKANALDEWKKIRSKVAEELEKFGVVEGKIREDVDSQAFIDAYEYVKKGRSKSAAITYLIRAGKSEREANELYHKVKRKLAAEKTEGKVPSDKDDDEQKIVQKLTEAGIKENEIRDIWVVIRPQSYDAKIDDVVLTSSPNRLILMARGGLDSKDLVGVYDNAIEARKKGVEILGFEKYGIGESKVNEVGPTDDEQPGAPNKDLQPDADVGEEEPAPEELIPDENEHDAVEADFDKIYLGQNDTSHFYVIAKKGDTGETEDLLITDQEGKELFSAKENDIDVHDVSKFILAALDSDKVNIMELERGVVLQYLVPQEEEEIEAEEEEEEMPGEEEISPKEEPEPKEEIPGKEAGVRTASQYRESKVNEDSDPQTRMIRDRFSRYMKDYHMSSSDALARTAKELELDWDTVSKAVGLPTNDSEKISETLSVKDSKGNTFSIQVIDEGSKDVVVQINNREFRFTPNFAALYEMEGGKLTEQGLQDLAQEVLGHLDDSEYAEVIGSGVQEDLDPSVTKEVGGDSLLQRVQQLRAKKDRTPDDDVTLRQLEDELKTRGRKEQQTENKVNENVQAVLDTFKSLVDQGKSTEEAISIVAERFGVDEYQIEELLVGHGALAQEDLDLEAQWKQPPATDVPNEGKVPSDKDDDEQKIVQKLTERTTPREGDIVQVLNSDGNSVVIPHAKVLEVDTTEPDEGFTVRLEGEPEDEWYDNTSYQFKILEPAEESKVKHKENESKISEKEGDKYHWKKALSGAFRDGLAQKAGKKPEDFDKEQLETGTKVEMEHTNEPSKAQQIAMENEAKMNERGWFDRAVAELKEDPKFQDHIKKFGPESENVAQYVVNYLGSGTFKKDVADLIKAVTGQVTEREYSDMAAGGQTKKVFQVEFVLDSGEKKSARVMAFSDIEAKAMLKRQKGVKDVINAKPVGDRNESPKEELHNPYESKKEKDMRKINEEELEGDEDLTSIAELIGDYSSRGMDWPQDEVQSHVDSLVSQFGQDKAVQLMANLISVTEGWTLEEIQKLARMFKTSPHNFILEAESKKHAAKSSTKVNENVDFTPQGILLAVCNQTYGWSVAQQLKSIMDDDFADLNPNAVSMIRELLQRAAKESEGELKDYARTLLDQISEEQEEHNEDSEFEEGDEGLEGESPLESKSIRTARDLLGLKEKGKEDDPVKVGDLVQIVDKTSFRVEVEEAIVKAVDENKGVEITGSTIPVSQKWYSKSYWFVSVLESKVNEDDSDNKMSEKESGTSVPEMLNTIIRAYQTAVGTTPVKGNRTVIEMLESYWGERSDFRVQKDGIYSVDADELMTWEDEKKFIQQEVDKEGIKKIYNQALEVLESAKKAKR